MQWLWNLWHGVVHTTCLQTTALQVLSPSLSLSSFPSFLFFPRGGIDLHLPLPHPPAYVGNAPRSLWTISVYHRRTENNGEVEENIKCSNVYKKSIKETFKYKSAHGIIALDRHV